MLVEIRAADGDGSEGQDHLWSRRSFLAGAVGLAAAAGLASCAADDDGPVAETGKPLTSTSAPPTTGKDGLVDPADAPFDTVVVLMMENRSFDHLLGWLPKADGKQSGLTFKDTAGTEHAPWPAAPDYQGWKYADPAHDWGSMAKHLNGGRCDGFLDTAPVGDTFPISYYTDEDLPVVAQLARSYTTFDRYFASFLGATWPNRFYQHCATTDVDSTGLFPKAGQEPPSKLELAIWDRLADAGLTGRYYFHSEPMTGLFRSGKYADISHPYEQFLADAKAGKLPNVAFVDPDYGLVAEYSGKSNDMHPHGSVQVGDAFIGEVYEALKSSPQWERMVFVLNFDESGGFYDHVAPPKVQDDTVNPDPGEHPDYRQLGFRVPCIAMGPFAPAKVEQAGPYEHCSILRMIEWRWDLEPMTKRDATAKNLAEALDLTSVRTSVPKVPDARPAPTEVRPVPAGL